MKRCKFLSVLLVALLITCLVTPSVYGKTKTKIAINSKKVDIEVGESYQLAVNGSKKTPTWTSADETIVTVDENGLITGINIGKAKVTGKIGSKKYSCTVTVKESNNITIKIPNDEYASEYLEKISFNVDYTYYSEDDSEIEIKIPKGEYDEYIKNLEERFKLEQSLGDAFLYALEKSDDNMAYYVYYDSGTQSCIPSLANSIYTGDNHREQMIQGCIKDMAVQLAYLTGHTIYDITINYIDTNSQTIVKSFKYVY